MTSYTDKLSANDLKIKDLITSSKHYDLHITELTGITKFTMGGKVPSILSIHSSRMAVCRAGNFK